MIEISMIIKYLIGVMIAFFICICFEGCNKAIRILPIAIIFIIIYLYVYSLRMWEKAIILRRFVLIKKEEKYCEISAKRLEEALANSYEELDI